MAYSYKNIDYSIELGIYRECLDNIKKSKGSIIAVSGDSSYGKTHLLEAFNTITNSKFHSVVPAFVQTQSPIGNFNIANIQPLQPFVRVIEYLMNYENISPEKKFMKQTAMTGLAVIPVVGEFFYAVKEIGNDWRQFKIDKSSTTARKVSSASADFFDTICAYSDKFPIAIIIDDMHWSDAQSVELLTLLTDRINDLPIIIVFSYKPNIILSTASPLISFISNNLNQSYFHHIELKPFNMVQISAFLEFHLPDYIKNPEFENWIYEKSFGVPGVISEYISYFKQNPPFNKDGSLKDDFKNFDHLPTSIHTVFSQTLNKLNDEERNILAVCSAEGPEFTALIAADLLNTDVLSTIKKLRSIQYKTGIIKSIGAKNRYGVTTTIYRFTQGFYHNYFEKSLEYEEHQALHGQIAALLKLKYKDADTEAIRTEIAPFLAAHSLESGDKETTKEMLLQSARFAQELGNADLLKNVYDTFSNIGEKKEEANDYSPEAFAFQEIINQAENLQNNISDTNSQNNPNPTSENGLSINSIDFKALRNAIVDSFNQGKYNQANQIASDAINSKNNSIDDGELTQLYALIIRNYTELEQFEKAEEYFNKAKEIINSKELPNSECMVLNAGAVLYSKLKRNSQAIDLLKKAAEISFNIAPELKLLTISNIAMIMNEYDPSEAQQYFKIARKMSASVNYDDFVADIYKKSK